MLQPEAAQALLDRAMPFTEPWRSKPIRDMDRTERAISKQDAEDSIRAAQWNLNNSDGDDEYQQWAYAQLRRARLRLEALKKFD